MGNQEKNYLIEGHLNEPATALYVDALLQDDQERLPEPILDHVDHCPDCKDKVLDLFMFMKQPDVPETGVAMPGVETLKPRPRVSMPVRVAAVFVAVAVSMAAYFLVLHNDPAPMELPGISQQGNNSPGNALVKAPKPDNNAGTTEQGPVIKSGQNSANRILARFRVNPNLENMVGSSSRSHAVRVISPLNNADLVGEIQFTLENLPQKTCRLKILDNKSRVLHSEILKENQFLLKEKLGPGLYYWKLETEKDLFHVGKFFIR